MKRLVSIGVSLLLLGAIYWKVDLRELAGVLRGCDVGWLVLSLSLVVPLTALTAVRLRQLVPAGADLSFAEAARLILAASALNMLLPSKMGDLVKAYFMSQRGHLRGSIALSLVVFEKGCDMLSLLAWCGFGLALYPRKDPFFWTMTIVVTSGFVIGLAILGSRRGSSLAFGLGESLAPARLRPRLRELRTGWQEMQESFLSDRGQLAKVILTSLFLWFAHLVQIWAFIVALRASVPFVSHLALSPLAILAGLVPLTFAGIGTRDAALIVLYAPYLAAPTAAALGLLCTLRYLLPAIGGWPFLGRYLVPAQELDAGLARSVGEVNISLPRTPS